MFYTIMTLVWVMNGELQVQEVKTDRGTCEYIQFQANNNWKGLQVKCQHYTKL